MLLSEEARMIQDAARRFAQVRLAPFAAEWDRARRLPDDLFRDVGEVGLMGMLVPEAWGGSNAGLVAFAAAVEEIAAGDGSTSTAVVVHNSLVCAPILKHGSESQKERFLPPLARGETLGCFALTEPHAGSDAARIKLRGRRDGKGWVLAGTKQFVTSGERADLALVFASTEPERGKDGITAFLVPTDAAGYRVARLENKVGQRASDTAQVVFEELRLPADAVLGEPGEGYRIALSTLEGSRIGIAAQAIGMARAAFEAALAYAKERMTFGKPIIEHQAVAFRLADMATMIESARQLTLHAALLLDSGRPCSKEAAMAKLSASEMSETVCSEAIQVHGGYGYVEDFPVERIWRDVRVCRIYEGTSDIQRIVISRALAEGSNP